MTGKVDQFIKKMLIILYKNLYIYIYIFIYIYIYKYILLRLTEYPESKKELFFTPAVNTQINDNLLPLLNTLKSIKDKKEALRNLLKNIRGNNSFDKVVYIYMYISLYIEFRVLP